MTTTSMTKATCAGGGAGAMGGVTHITALGEMSLEFSHEMVDGRWFLAEKQELVLLVDAD